jgi:hypothetical protein
MQLSQLPNLQLYISSIYRFFKENKLLVFTNTGQLFNQKT